MNIKGLNISQIGKKMEPYLVKYFEGYKIQDTGEIFMEVIRLAYDEIEHLLIHPDDNQLFVNDEWFAGASGYIILSNPNNNSSNSSKEIYMVSLIMDEEQTQALFLYVTKWNDHTKNSESELVKNFTKSKE